MIRACVYKGCDNYYIGSTAISSSGGGFTLFQFPQKDAERRKRWMQLGEVPTNLNPHQYLMCSQHFDKRFISKNQRRTVLVGTAVPHPHGCTDITESQQEQVEDVTYIEEANVVKAKEETVDSVNEHRVESTTMQEYDEYTAYDEIEEEDCISVLEDPFSESSAITDNQSSEAGSSAGAKRKVIEYTAHPNSKAAHRILQPQVSRARNTCKNEIPLARNCTTTSPPPPSNPGKQKQRNRKRTKAAAASTYALNEEDAADALINRSSVSVFIFKEEEYVQMTKKYYVEEKIALLRKIKQYEALFKRTKRNVDKTSLLLNQFDEAD